MLYFRQSFNSIVKPIIFNKPNFIAFLVTSVRLLEISIKQGQLNENCSVAVLINTDYRDLMLSARPDEGWT